MPFCQTAFLLVSVTWQQNVMEYCWEGLASAATLPTFDFMVQYNKIVSITFKPAFVCIIYICTQVIYRETEKNTVCFQIFHVLSLSIVLA